MSSNVGFNVTGVLQVTLTTLFVGLKLTHQIDWSWIMVFSPLWIPFLALLAFVILGSMTVSIWIVIRHLFYKAKRFYINLPKVQENQ